MVELGSFSFRVEGDTSPAIRSLDQLAQRAQQIGAQVQGSLGKMQAQPLLLKADGTPLINAVKQAEASVQKLGQAVKQVTDRPAVLTIKSNLNEAEQSLAHLVNDARAIGDAKLNLTANVGNVKNAQQAIGQLSEALRTARAGETINVQVRAETVEQATQTLRRLNTSIEAAKQAGARVNVNVATNAQGASNFGQFGQGAIQQLTPGLSSAPAVALGVIAAQGLQRIAGAFGDAVKAGLAYNAMLETSAIQLKVFIGSAEGADQALQQLRRNADITPFDTEEVVRSGAIFAQVANGSIQRMQHLVDLAEQLAAVNPNPKLGGGLEGGTTAIREALGGDFTSIRERFNVSAVDIQRIKDLGLSGEALAAALVKAAGGSKALVDQLGDTFQGRLSTAKAHMDELGASATKPIFDALSNGLKLFNDAYDQSSPRLKELSEILGKLSLGGLADAVLPGTVSVVAHAALPPPIATQQPAQQGQSDAERQREAAAQRINEQIDAQNKKINEQKKLLEDLKKDNDSIGAAVKEVTLAYEQQLHAIQANGKSLLQNRDALQQQLRDLKDAQNGLDQRREAAGPSQDTRAEAAGAQVLLDHEQELMDIRHKRAELSEQIARAEESAAERVAEKQITASERALEALQQRVRAENEARTVALEALQEEIRKRQEARQIALEALSEIIRARQEERQAALDALREEIQGRQQARREALDGLREQIQARRDAADQQKDLIHELNDEEERAYQDDIHREDQREKRRQQRYQDEISNLQDQLKAQERIDRVKSAAQRELEAFNKAATEAQRARTLAEAQRAVLQARTGRERSDALQRLHDTQAQQAEERKREEIQARIDKEKEESDKKRQAIQDKIQEVERKARDEDRRYQREKDQRDELHRQVLEAQQADDRKADREERERRRAEDAQVRAAEKADKEATKREEAQIKAAEKQAREEEKADQAALRNAQAAARAEDRADQAKLRAQQQADREADRAAQAQILDLQQKILTARNNLSDRREGFQDVLDAAALQRLREQADLENRILDVRERLAKATDATALASAAADQVRLDDAVKHAQQNLDGIENRIAAIKAKEDAELSGLKLVADDIDVRIDRAKRAIDDLNKQLDALKAKSEFLAHPVKPDDLDAPSHHSPAQTAVGAGTSAGSTWAQQFLDGMKSVWTSQQARQVGVDLGSTVGPGFAEGVIKASADTGGGAGSAGGKSITDTIWEQITKSLTTTRTPPPGAIAGVATILTSVFQQGTQQATDQSDPGGQAADAVSDGLQTAQQALGQQLADVLNGAWAQAAPVADAIPVEIGTHLAAIPDLSPLIASIGQALTDALNGAWAQAVPTADAIPVEIANHLAVLPDGFVDTISAPLGQGLTDAANAAWAAAVPVVDDIPVQIAAHLSDPGPDLRQFGTDFGDRLTEAANAAWAQTAPTVDDIPVQIAAHLETAIAMEAANFQREGGEVADHFSDGWVTYNWANMAQLGMNAVKVKLNEIAPSFEGFGAGAATYWQNGWTRAMNSWSPPVPSAPTGGGGGGGGGGGPTPGPGGGTPTGPSPAPTPRPGPPITPTPPEGRGCPPGWHWDPGLRQCVPDQPANVNVQSASLRAAGSVLPPSLSLAIHGNTSTTAASPTLTATGGTRPNLTVQVNVSGTGLDVNQLASAIQRQTVAAVVDIFDTYERTAPSPVSRILPGAQR